MPTPPTRTGIATAPGRGPLLETVKRSDGSEIPFVVSVNVGVWGYRAGQAGTIVVPQDARLLSFSCIAGPTGATVTVNDGDAIIVPESMGFGVSVDSDVFSPTLKFVGTVSYFVQYVMEGAA